ncbi:hypothetical protein [Marinobacter daepoensis]|uniref:hypothetical protein n=1 Tax=Marinobacter daepoensis TaxID=262077 RepID=UPI0003FCF8B8|nr:hypothetical protein [Marinobacter daepoensis]
MDRQHRKDSLFIIENLHLLCCIETPSIDDPRDYFNAPFFAHSIHRAPSLFRSLC